MLGDAVLAVLILLGAGIVACLLLALLGCVAGLALSTWQLVYEMWRAGRR